MRVSRADASHGSNFNDTSITHAHVVSSECHSSTFYQEVFGRSRCKRQLEDNRTRARRVPLQHYTRDQHSAERRPATTHAKGRRLVAG